LLSRVRSHPVLASAFAVALAVIAVLAIARVTGADAVGRAFDHVDPPWIALIAAAEVAAYGGYVIAYRSIARIHGDSPLALPFVARVVVAGFGPFSVGGGFGVDKQVLNALHEDEHTARVHVMALGTVEWAVLAPAAAVTSIVMLATHANVMASLLWPWALAVPAGFACALFVSSPRNAERLCRIRGVRRPWLDAILRGVGVLHPLLRQPRTYVGAWIGTGIYWAADIAAFYGGLRCFGLDPGTGKVIIAYATGYAATRRSLPLGGAGVTEALMTYSLYWVRQPLAPALAAVVAYRAFNLVVAAMPGLIAHRQLNPLLAEQDAASSAGEP
jgi:uncharacterized membrane protein YbhN (UPF0104 family)